MSACLPIILGAFTLIYTIQQSQIARDNREQDKKQLNEIREENIYKRTFTIKTSEKERLNLVGADLTNIKFEPSSTFHCQLDEIYLSGVLASNIIFSHCRMWDAIFDRAILINAKFINCSMAYSNFVSVDLTNAKFLGHGTNARNINFSNLSMSLPMRNANLTNTDTFNSYITFSTNISRRNNFLNTRLPNGTFTNIDTSQLIKDGSTGYWLQRKEFSSIEYSKDSDGNWIPKAIDGNSYLKIFFNSRAFQDIDVHHFSLFIDNNNACFNLSAYLTCPFNQNRTDITDIYIQFYVHKPSFKYTLHVIKDKLTNTLI